MTSLLRVHHFYGSSNNYKFDKCVRTVIFNPHKTSFRFNAFLYLRQISVLYFDVQNAFYFGENMTTHKASLIKQISFMFFDEIYKEMFNGCSSKAIIISNASLNIVPVHFSNSCLTIVSKRYFFTSKQANKCEPSDRYGQ